MSSVSSVTSPRSSAVTSGQDTTTPATALPKQTLGQDDFLKLLATQFQAQDPMKPVDDTAFIAQMAQFSSLQETSAMAKDITAMRSDQSLATANTYLGQRVTVDDGNGGTDTGDVTGVEVTDGTPRIVVGNYTYDIANVLLVQPAAISTPTTPPPTTSGAGS